MFQTTGQDKTLETDQIKWRCGLPDKEFKIMVIKMLTEDRRTMQEQSENFNKNRKYKNVPDKSQS